MRMHRKTLAILVAVLVIAGLTVGGVVVLAQERGATAGSQAAETRFPDRRIVAREPLRDAAPRAHARGHRQRAS